MTIKGVGMRAALVAAVLSTAAGSAMAKTAAKTTQKTTAKTPPKKVEKAAPKANPEAIKALMGGFKWGMSVDQTLEVLNKQIDDKYEPDIKKLTDVYEQNKLRKKAAKEKADLKKTFTEFGDKESSWDVSIVDKEFDHKNGESMLVDWEVDPASNKDQRRFYFFEDGKLWKMFIAFNADMFPDSMTFAAFQAAMEKRYGAGAIQMRTDEDGTEHFDFVYWKSPGYFLRAIDLTKFYSTYCLAISDDGVEKTIYARREERNPKSNNKNPLVDAVTDDPTKDKNKVPDQNSDVIDRITNDGGGDKTPKKK
jgi:hypothetical protein